MKKETINEFEIPVSIKGLIMHICLKWKMILVWAILLAILFNVVGVVRDYKSKNSGTDEVVLTDEERIENEIKDIEDQLTETGKLLNKRELMEAEEAAGVYADLWKRYNEALVYNNESAKMHFDANHIFTLTIQYLIDTNYIVEYPVIEKKDDTNAILAAISNNIVTENVCRDIANIIPEDIDATYVEELIETKYYDRTLQVTFIYSDKKVCKEVSKILQARVESICSDLQNTFGKFDYKLLCNNYMESADTVVLSDQIVQGSNITSAKNAMYYLTSGMSDDQKVYYTLMIDYDNLLQQKNAKEENIYGDSWGVANEEKTVGEHEVRYLHKKLFILGLLVGIFLVVVWTGMSYLLSPRMREFDDMEEVFGIKCLGILQGEKNSNINRIILKKFGKLDVMSLDDRIQMLCKEIEVIANKNNIKSISIASSYEDSFILEIKEKICNILKTRGVNINICASVMNDLAAFNMVMDSEGVVFVERQRKSKYEDIKSELQKCNANEINVIGGVVVD